MMRKLRCAFYLRRVGYLVLFFGSVAAWGAPVADKSAAARHAAKVKGWNKLTADEAASGELIVLFKAEEKRQKPVLPFGVASRRAAKARDVGKTLGVKETRDFSRFGYLCVTLPDGVSLEAAAKQYLAEPTVRAVSPNYRRHATAIPNDFYYNFLWGMDRINAPAAWDENTGSSDVLVGILDSGVSLRHEDLAANIWFNTGEDANDNGVLDPDDYNGIDDDGNGFVDDVNGWDFIQDDNDPSDVHGHGTHVAGTVGAVGNNEVGVTGVNWAPKLVPIRILDDDGYGYDAGINAAIIYSQQVPGLKVTCNSWGGGPSNETTMAIIEDSMNAGQLFVAAAGNDSVNNDFLPHYPSSYPLDNIIAVASVDESGLMSWFSCYGLESVDLAAPGGNIYSTSNSGTNQYEYMSGTSMATPHVAGAAAWLYAEAPDATWEMVKSAIVNGARPNVNLTGFVASGGELDLLRARAFLSGFVVEPMTDTKAGGGINCPMFPSEHHYLLSNVGKEDVNWEVTASENWVTVSPASGLMPGRGEFLENPVSSENVTVSYNANISLLSPGDYTNTLTFSDLATAPTNDVVLYNYIRVSPNYHIQSRSTPFEWYDTSDGVDIPQAELGTTMQPLFSDFTFYDIAYSNVVVGAEGTLTFGSGTRGSENRSFPDLENEHAVIAPYWDDLVYGADSSVEIAPFVDGGVTNGTVVTWRDMYHAEATPALMLTFQAVLYAPVDSNSWGDILFNYWEVGEDRPPLGQGLSATVGVQGEDGVVASQLSHNGVSTNGPSSLANHQGVLFSYYEMYPDSTDPGLKACSASDALIDFGASFVVRLEEIAVGLDSSDIDISASTAEGPLMLTNFDGGGERFTFGVAGITNFGYVDIAIPANSFVDLSGNPNATISCARVPVQYQQKLLDTDFETGEAFVAPSDNVYETYTTEGWEFGAPDPAYANGPAAAYSGSNCWGVVLDGPYVTMTQSYLQLPRIFTRPGRLFLSFRAWYDMAFDPLLLTQTDYLVVEVGDGGTWVNVTPEEGLRITGSSNGSWDRFYFELPESLAGGPVFTRFRFVSGSPNSVINAGVYVDDLQLVQIEEPGIWVIDYSPKSVAPSSSQSVDLSLYNSSYGEIDPYAMMGSADIGVTVAPESPYDYVPFSPGEKREVNQVVSLNVTNASALLTDELVLDHSAFSEGQRLTRQSLPVHVTGLDLSSRTNILFATTTAGVRDWNGDRLPGAGGLDASLVQIIGLGDDGVAAPPALTGSPGGDDQLLYTFDDGLGYLRMGDERYVTKNLGQFGGAMRFGPAHTGMWYIARAWDGPRFVDSVAYGDSDPRWLGSLDDQTLDFGAWGVETPIVCSSDWNDDTLPDSFLIRHAGGDPRLAGVVQGALDLAAVGESSSFEPSRLAVAGDFLYATCRVEDGIKVFDASALTELSSTFTNSAPAYGSMKEPEGIAVSATGDRLLVADTENRRVLGFDVDPGTGALTYDFQVPTVVSDEMQADQEGQFDRPVDVAFAPDGRMLVLDRQPRFVSFGGYHRIQVFSGVDQTYLGELGAPGNALVTPSSLSCDDTYAYVTDRGNHSVLRYRLSDLSFDSYILPPGSQGPALGQVDAPVDVHISENGYLYVSEAINNRIQIFDPSLTPVGAFPSATFQALFSTDIPTPLNAPNSVFPYPTFRDEHRIYIADSGNNRILSVELLLDVDSDGMDDVWESIYGVDDPDGDVDGDGLSNLGEYRASSDPNNPDTNGNGADDLWDAQHCLDPVEPAATVDPPSATNMSASVAQVEVGSNVTITVYYDEAIATNSSVTITLSGGAVLFPQAMVRQSPTVYTYTYTAQSGDAGLVDVAVAGAEDLDALSQDSTPASVAALFEVVDSSLPPAGPFWITTLNDSPLILEWESVAGYTYTLQSSTNLSSTNWVDVSGPVVAPATGVQGYTNVTPAELTLFYRVLRDE